MFLLELFSLSMIVTFTSAQEGSVDRRVPNFIASRGKKQATDIGKEVALFDYESVDKVEDHADDARYATASKSVPYDFNGAEEKMSRVRTTRGKKSYDPLRMLMPRANRLIKNELAKADMDDYLLVKNELAKRKFHGMRGKKWASYRPLKDMNPIGIPFAGGVRGKKYDATELSNRPAEVYTGAVDTDFLANLATTMYLLSNTDKGYSKHHSESADPISEETLTSDIESQVRDQRISPNYEISSR